MATIDTLLQARDERAALTDAQKQEPQTVHSVYELPIMAGAAVLVAIVVLGKVVKRRKKQS